MNELDSLARRLAKLTPDVVARIDEQLRPIADSGRQWTDNELTAWRIAVSFPFRWETILPLVNRASGNEGSVRWLFQRHPGIPPEELEYLLSHGLPII